MAIELADDRPVELRVDLSEAEAFALAELCKRITWHDCKTLSIDEAECRLMLSSTFRVRQALQHQGVYVR